MTSADEDNVSDRQGAISGRRADPKARHGGRTGESKRNTAATGMRHHNTSGILGHGNGAFTAGNPGSARLLSACAGVGVCGLPGFSAALIAAEPTLGT